MYESFFLTGCLGLGGLTLLRLVGGSSSSVRSFESLDECSYYDQTYTAKSTLRSNY